MNLQRKMIESNVKITDEEKLNTYVTEKSWFRYNQILDKMLSFKVTLSDVNLHDYYRYDIRLRRLLFKYLTAYEIKLRGKVLNSIKEGFEKVECLSFGQLIDQYYFDQPDLVKVKDLRNLIFHHRMIQLEDECEVIEAINIILKKLKREKFYSELEMLKEDLLLVKAFFITDENIKYDYVRSD